MNAGDIYTIVGGGSSGLGNGGPATSAELSQPRGLDVDASGNVLIADYDDFAIRMVATSSGTFYGQAVAAGDIYTIAGTGHPYSTGPGATGTGLISPTDVAVDASGNVLIATDKYSTVYAVAAGTGTFYGRSMTENDAYMIAGTGGEGDSGDGGPATAALLDVPGGLALDSSGNVLIADAGNNRIREISPYGTQAVTFTSTTPADATVGGTPYSVTATGGASGNPVTFSSKAPSVCTITGTTVSFVGVGTCTVDADQAGNANYDSAPEVSQSFSVGQGSQAITFTSTQPADAVYGGPTYFVSRRGEARGIR